MCFGLVNRLIDRWFDSTPPHDNKVEIFMIRLPNCRETGKRGLVKTGLVIDEPAHAEKHGGYGREEPHDGQGGCNILTEQRGQFPPLPRFIHFSSPDKAGAAYGTAEYVIINLFKNECIE